MKLSRSLLEKIRCFFHEEGTWMSLVRKNVVDIRACPANLSTEFQVFQPRSDAYVSAISSAGTLRSAD